MTRVLKKFVCALFLVSLLAGTSLADSLNFTLVNRSGFTMTKVILCPAGVKAKWREQYEVKGSFPVYPGDKIDVSAEGACYQLWDMLIAFEDGRHWELHNVDISAARTILVNVDGRALDETGKYHDFPNAKARLQSKSKVRSAAYRTRTYRRPHNNPPRRYYRTCPRNYRYKRAK